MLFAVVKLFGGDDDPAAASGRHPRSTVKPTSAAPTSDRQVVDPPRPHTAPGETTGRQRVKARRPPQSDGPCRPDEVLVKPVVSAGNKAGDPVEIRLRMRTSGRPACTLNVAPENLLVRVTSGSDLIWTSQDCPSAILASELVVRRGKPLTYRVPWSGHRSAPRCPLQTEPALPGTYVAAAAIIGGEPAETSFVLEPQPTSQPTDSARDRRR